MTWFCARLAGFCARFAGEIARDFGLHHLNCQKLKEHNSAASETEACQPWFPHVSPLCSLFHLQMLMILHPVLQQKTNQKAAILRPASPALVYEGKEPHMPNACIHVVVSNPHSSHHTGCQLEAQYLKSIVWKKYTHRNTINILGQHLMLRGQSCSNLPLKGG